MTTFLKFYVLIYIIFYLSIIKVIRTFLRSKKIGVKLTTFGRKPGSVHDYVGFLFKMTHSLTLAILLINVFYEFNKIRFLDNLFVQILGIILSIFAFWLSICAQNNLGESWRLGIDEIVQTRLITTGLYNVSRNPFFTGMLLSLFSLFLLLPTYIMGFLFILSFVTVNIQIRLEEEHHTRVHGDKYMDYKNRVNRFIPKWN